jgi:hypothetical protein
MQLAEIQAVRTKSDELPESRWTPVDLTCVDADAREVIIRTKLVRDPDSAAMCVSEAVAHRILACVGLRTADAFAVIIGGELAAGLTTQFNFDPPVQTGRHWGTKFLTAASETTVHPSDYHNLNLESDIFLLYLVDVLTAYEDRQTHGNVLFVPAADVKRLDILPIDQSDCFGHPDVLRHADRLTGIRDRSFGKAFDGMDQLAARMGRKGIDAALERISAATACLMSAVEVPPDEWYGRAAIDPSVLRDFIAYRLKRLEELGRLSHWREIADIASGGAYGPLFSS